jgi:hypothetical protein
VSDVIVECEISRFDDHLTTVDGGVCSHYLGHVYCALHYISSKRNHWLSITYLLTSAHRPRSVLKEHFSEFRLHLTAELATFDPVSR